MSGVEGASPDGFKWESQNSGTDSHLYSVSVIDGYNAVASGLNGTLKIWNGSSWEDAPGFEAFRVNEWGSRNELQSVFAFSSTDIYVGAYDPNVGAIAYWNGVEWVNSSTGTGRRVVDLWGYAEEGTDNRYLLAARINGYIHRVDYVNQERTGVTTLMTETDFGNYTVSNIVGTGADNIWATGPRPTAGTILFSKEGGNRGTWVSSADPNIGVLVPLYSLSSELTWVRSNSNLYLASYSEDTEEISFVFLNDFGVLINDVYALSEDQIWVVGNNGLVSFWDGNSWSSLDFGITSNLRSIDGDGENIWIVGNNGQIFYGSAIPEPLTVVSIGFVLFLLLVQRKRLNRN